MNNYAMNPYMKTGITTSDSGKLIVLLYEGAIRFLRDAQDGISENNIEKRNNNIVFAVDIIDELRNSLNMSEGKEIAGSLNALYLFMGRHLTAANYKNSFAMIQEVMDMLLSLKEAWEDVASNPEIISMPAAGSSTGASLSAGVSV